MKRNTIFSAMTAIVLATVLSGCFGLGTSLGMDYGPGYDDLWYDGYGNNYYGGYYGPDYGYGPWLPAPPPRPPHHHKPEPKPPVNSGSNTPHRPAVGTTPSGVQRPGNNGLPTQSVGGAQSVRPRREPASSAATARPSASPSTTTGRGRK